MEKLRVNNTPVRTSRNFLINNLEVELEIPQKDEFTNLKIINEKSNIDNNVSNKPLTYGMGKILEELNYETANSKIRIQKENIQIIYEFDDNNINLINQIEIIANGNTNVTIVYKSKTSKKCFHNGIIRTTVKENAQLNVTIINLLNEESDNLEAIRKKFNNKLYNNRYWSKDKRFKLLF